MLNGRAWALRDDLNTLTSSQPYVLVSYADADTRPSMVVFKVLREKPDVDPAKNYVFNYRAEAGKVLQAPMPLPILPLPNRPVQTQGWTWQSSNGGFAWFPASKATQDVANHEVPSTTPVD